MEVGTVCRRLVFVIRRSDEVSRAPQLMREKHVGYLVVVELNPLARPVGVLTDRDIVVGVVARQADPKAVRVGDIMTLNPVMALESDSVEAALQKISGFVGCRSSMTVASLSASSPWTMCSRSSPLMPSKSST